MACGWYLELGVVGICGCGVLLLWPGAVGVVVPGAGQVIVCHGHHGWCGVC